MIYNIRWLSAHQIMVTRLVNGYILMFEQRMFKCFSFPHLMEVCSLDLFYSISVIFCCSPIPIQCGPKQS